MLKVGTVSGDWSWQSYDRLQHRLSWARVWTSSDACRGRKGVSCLSHYIRRNHIDVSTYMLRVVYVMTKAMPTACNDGNRGYLTSTALKCYSCCHHWLWSDFSFGTTMKWLQWTLVQKIISFSEKISKSILKFFSAHHLQGQHCIGLCQTAGFPSIPCACSTN